MSFSIGIIGLPNVGKSTTFNALIKEQIAQVANYPFCTIEPNQAIVPVPDERVERLAELVGVERAIHTTVRFVDVAGLVRGASQGEGLGNQFLGNIRDVDALLHVVRCFEDPNVVHVSAQPEPGDDIETINIELALADLGQLERRIERLEGQVKGDKKFVPVLEMALAMKEYLGVGQPLRLFPQREAPAAETLIAEMRFLTAKPVIYVANVDESGLQNEPACVLAVRQIAEEEQAEMFSMCARLEEDLAALPVEDRDEYLELAGIEESGLDRLVRKSYNLLGLISYFSFNEQEVRAWSIPAGTTAPKAAGVIHSDFERGFIKAEAASYEVFSQYGSWAALREAGRLRIEGREYVVQDGDVIYFRFNV